MKRIFSYILPLLILIPPPLARTQYIGTARTWPGERIADSLAAKPDTSALNSLKARFESDSAKVADSLAALRQRSEAKIDSNAIKAGDNIEITRHASNGSLDSLTISSTASGGGISSDSLFSGFPKQFDYIIGWDGSAEETITLTKKTGVDTTSGDTLFWCMKQLISTGGNIFIKPGDTLWVERAGVNLGDSVAMPIHIFGYKRMSVIRIRNGAYWNFDEGYACLGGIYFHDLHMLGGPPASCTIYALRLKYGKVYYDNCWLQYGCISGQQGEGVAVATNCTLDSLCIYPGSGSSLDFENCHGSIYNIINAAGCILTFRACKIDYVTWAGGTITTFQATTVTQIAGNNSLSTSELRAFGSQFLFQSEGSGRNVSASERAEVFGCRFNYGGLVLNYYYNCIYANLFRNAVLALDVNNSNVSIKANHFKSCTTCIDLASGKNKIFIRNNSYGTETTFIVDGGATFEQSLNDDFE
ncbi:MAG TPA: hypothetical protein VM123_16430 [archaeon]|nr:hypothetical protein [archaeon]